FFFQAEDGIRDWSVTGVQTCALPICLRCACGRSRGPRCASDSGLSSERLERLVDLLVRRLERVLRRGLPGQRRVDVVVDRLGDRSEERRVGKEWRCGWGGDYLRRERG